MSGDKATDGAEPTDVLAASPHPPLQGELRLAVVAGPDRGRYLLLRAGVQSIGKDPSCDFPLTDRSVSRRHLEVVLLRDGVQVRDLGSTNGSFLHGAAFDAVRIGLGASVVIGQTELCVIAAEPSSAGASRVELGGLLATSAAMRRVLATIERVARSDTSVLIQGETGTGKELVAEALHSASLRSDKPFVVCDLAAITRALIESELFGHVRGAFTGADRDRPGAFVQADGGTLFLDEVGELDSEAQPRLLRALERHQVKPVGDSTYRTVDVRVIAATNRDLAAETEAGRFREDLYHRLGVVRLVLPALRDRPEDIPLLVEHFLSRAAVASSRPAPAVPPATMSLLAEHDWPGNVRELRNVLERALALAPDAPSLDPSLLGFGAEAPTGRDPPPPAVDVPFKEAKDHLVHTWEREYLTTLLAKAGGNVSQAARSAGIDRVYLHRLLKKHGLGA